LIGELSQMDTTKLTSAMCDLTTEHPNYHAGKLWRWASSVSDLNLSELENIQSTLQRVSNLFETQLCQETIDYALTHLPEKIRQSTLAPQ